MNERIFRQELSGLKPEETASFRDTFGVAKKFVKVQD